MSHICNVILAAEPLDDAPGVLAALNSGAWAEHAGHFRLMPELPISVPGGRWALECDFFIGAFNYLELDELKAHIRELHRSGVFDEIDHVELIYKDDDDDGFTIWRASTGAEADVWRDRPERTDP